MSTTTFLDLPLTIRHQIYTSLLVPSLTQNAQGQLTHSKPSTSILYVNRTIHDEASLVFYARNLFVVVHASDPAALRGLTQHKAPLFATVTRPAAIAQCPRFAVAVHLASLKTLLPARRSAPSCVVTAETLPLFFAALASPATNDIDVDDAASPNPFTKPGGVATFRTLNSFGYTPARFSHLVFGRLAALPRPPVLTALRISGAVAPLHYAQMMRWCEESTELAQARRFPWLVEHALGIYVGETKRSGAGVEELREAWDVYLGTVDMYWACFDFHRPDLDLASRRRIRDDDGGDDGGGAEARRRIVHVDAAEAEEQERAIRLALYDTLLTASNTLTRHVFLLAKHSPSPSSPFPSISSHATYIHARAIAETTLAYLNRPDRSTRLVQPLPLDATAPRYTAAPPPTAQNAMLSLKAARACAKLGDVAAAETYLRDVREMGFFGELVGEKLADLKDGVERGGGVEIGGPAVLWRREAWVEEGGEGMAVDSPEFKRCCELLERRCVLGCMWRSMPL